jgi:hypothetical protein
MICPRYSLQSLLLLVLLAASAVTLFQSSPAWRTDRVIPGTYGFVVSSNGNLFAGRNPDLVSITLYRTNGEVLCRLPKLEYYIDDIYFLNEQYLVLNRLGKVGDFGADAISTGPVVWDIEARRWVSHWVFEPFEKPVWSNDKRHILASLSSSEEPNRLRLIDAGSGETRHSWKGPKLHANFSFDSKLLSLKTNYSLEIWDVETLQCLQRFETHHGETFLRYDFAYWAVLDRQAARVSVQSRETGATIFNLPVREKLKRISLISNSLHVLYATSEGVLLEMWDIESGKLSQKFGPSGEPFEHSIIAWYFTPDAHLCVEAELLSDRANRIYVWDAKSTQFKGSWVFRSRSFTSNLKVIDLDGKIYRIPSKNPAAEISGEFQDLSFIPKKENLLATRYKYSPAEGGRTDLLLISQHRPEPWWGLAWLPAFWTTLLLAALFIWNLFRSSKSNQQKSPA